MKLKKINHIGIVVRNLEKAKAEYSALYGIKKWYRLVNSTPLDMTYKGVKSNCDVTLYFGGKGSTKIELIYTTGDENIYTDFLQRHGEGIHHIMYNVKNLITAIDEFKTFGYDVIQNANFKSAGSDIKYAYLGKNQESVIIELIETTMFLNIKKGDMPFEYTLGRLTGNYKLVK